MLIGLVIALVFIAVFGVLLVLFFMGAFERSAMNDSLQSTVSIGKAATILQQLDEQKSEMTNTAQQKLLATPTDPLKDPRPDVRRQAAESMGKLKDSKAVPSLIALLTDESNDVRDMAAWALGQIKDPQSIPGMIQTLKYDYFRKIAAALVQIGTATSDPLVNALEDKDETIRSRARLVLRRIQEPLSVDSLAATLKDGDREARIHAAWELRGIVKGSKAVTTLEPLIEALSDQEYEVRANVAEALGELKDPRAVEPLINALKTSSLFRPAAWALGEIKDPRSVPPLVSSLSSADQRIRESAAAALSRIGAVAVEPLIAVLKTPNRDVKENATWALGEIKDPRAVAPLMALLRDESMGVRAKAAEALGSLHATAALLQLISALKDTKLLVRVKAAEALGMIKNPDAIQPLSDALKDDNQFVRESAANALGEINDPRGIDALIEALSDESNAATAKVLARMTGMSFTRKEQWHEWRVVNRAMLHGR